MAGFGVFTEALAAAVMFPQTSYAARKAACLFLFSIRQFFSPGSMTWVVPAYRIEMPKSTIWHLSLSA